MDFDYSPELDALRDMCRTFAAREIRPFAAEWSEQRQFPASVYRSLGDLGLMGMLVEEKYGGSAAGMVAYVTAMEERGKADQSFASGWNAHSTIASLPLATFGTDSQKEQWLRPLASGTHIGAFGLTEPMAGSDARSLRTRAARVDGGWLVNGAKMFITNAGTEMSLGVTLIARTGDDEEGKGRFGVFFVPDGTPGYTKGAALKKLGWHACDTRELTFVDVWLSDEHLIGDEGQGWRQFMEVIHPGRVSVAALALALAEAALEMAVDYAHDRQQFGRRLDEFQAIEHKLADMATEVEAARWLVYRAAWLADAGRPYGQEAAMAKLYASEVANRAASQSLQIHGGYGYMRETPISRFYADAKVLEIGEGTSEVQRNIIARGLRAGLGVASR